ncbi:MAG: type II restriction endonuclease [Paludibacteraceae bacterium]|nr:type II restriction endonuclease [Paludibacteraceae bacterium]
MKKTKKDFDIFISQLSETNASLDFFCDFDKISANVANIEISLNTLNYLLGKNDLRKAVEAIWERDKTAFDVLDILIATRKESNKKFFNNKGEKVLVHSLFSSVDGIMEFLEGTGLDKVLKNSEVNNLVDYVFGVETGLDTNARKNRSGKITEKLIAEIFNNYKIPFKQQVSSTVFPKIDKILGADKKVFDFVIDGKNETYLIEVNFYSGGGSKLNETARSYTDIGPKINSIKGYRFVWITDGEGWKNAKNKLQEAFMSIPDVYNLTTINKFISSIK